MRSPADGLQAVGPLGAGFARTFWNVLVYSPELWADVYFSTRDEEPLGGGGGPLRLPSLTHVGPDCGRLTTNVNRLLSLSLFVEASPAAPPAAGPTNSPNYVPIMPLCATPSQLTDFTESAI